MSRIPEKSLTYAGVVYMADAKEAGPGNAADFKNKITRRDFLRRTGMVAGGAAAAGLGFAKGVKAQTVPPAPPPTGPNANVMLLNNRLPSGSWSNSGLPYPTSTYYDSGQDQYTNTGLNPNSTNKNRIYGFTDGLGNPLIVNTRIHDVKFCNGIISSSVVKYDQYGKIDFSNPESGIVNFIPQPVLKTLNGVSYYEYLALLSGVGFSSQKKINATGELNHYVYGPMAIDSSGNPYDASVDPVTGHPVDYNTWAGMGYPSTISPRNGLTYLPVYVAYPAQGWNGKLIHYVHWYAGFDNFAWFFPYQTYIDVQYLLKQGYAVCIYQGDGGLLDDEKNINAQNNHWWDDSARWLVGDPGITWRLLAREAMVDGNGNESLVPSLFGMCSSNPAYCQSVYSSFAPYPPADEVYPDATMARNVVHLVKNLLWYKLGQKTISTYMLGHSRSTETVFSVNCGRLNSASNVYGINGLTPRTGGNFVDPYNPSSGLVYNGFFDRCGWLTMVINSTVDPQFPITAPLIATLGSIDGDVTTPDSLAPVLKIKKFRSDLDLNQWARFYVVNLGTHMPRSSHFTTLYNGSNWFYQFGDGQPNQDGNGSRLNFYMGGIADALTRIGYPPGTLPPDPLSSYDSWGTLDSVWTSAMEAGFMHKCIDNLIAWAEQGIAPPVSRVWERIVNDPYHAWIPDLPLYFWSNYDMAPETTGNAWPYFGWVFPEVLNPATGKMISGCTYVQNVFPDYPLWTCQGGTAVFDLTDFYRAKWGQTYYSVSDPTPNPQSINPYYGIQRGAPQILDPYWENFVYRTLRPVVSDCTLMSFGLDDMDAGLFFSTIGIYLPRTENRDTVNALKNGQLFNYSTEPLNMPNIAVRLGLYIGDTYWTISWPSYYPFSASQLLNGYTDPYGNHYAGYANHGDYVNRMKDAVDSLISQGLFDANIGHATVLNEAVHTPYPLPKLGAFTRQITQVGFYSDLTNRYYATIQEREKAEERLGPFFGRSVKRRKKWG